MEDAITTAVNFQISEIERLRKIIRELNEEVRILKGIRELDEHDKIRLGEGLKEEEFGDCHYPDELLPVKHFPEYW